MPVSFYWDRNDASRAWGKRIMARNKGEVPTMGHAAAYVATTYYLKAVVKAGIDDAAAVDKALKELPIDDGMFSRPHMLANGRVVFDVFVVEVKKLSDSTNPTDPYKVLATLPGDKLFNTADKGGCPLTSTN
jgi:branched-chain amino acid transport system substrate-binding protein